MFETVRWILFALGLVGLVAIYYWTWNVFIRPFVAPKIGWGWVRPHPRVGLIGGAGMIAFMTCVLFLPVVGR